MSKGQHRWPAPQATSRSSSTRWVSGVGRVIGDPDDHPGHGAGSTSGGLADRPVASGHGGQPDGSAGPAVPAQRSVVADRRVGMPAQAGQSLTSR
jgi:hypothetical protein